MGKVNIPTIGTEWVLKKDWTFRLVSEYRNETLFKVLGIEQPPRARYSWVTKEEGGKPEWTKPEDSFVEVTLPKGTLLIVDRIYIRKGGQEFDSITFRMPGRATERETKTYMQKTWGGSLWGPDGRYIEPYVVSEKEVTYTVPKKPVRFWARLSDVNLMEVR